MTSLWKELEKMDIR